MPAPKPPTPAEFAEMRRLLAEYDAWRAETIAAGDTPTGENCATMERLRVSVRWLDGLRPS